MRGGIKFEEIKKWEFGMMGRGGEVKEEEIKKWEFGMRGR